MGERATTVGIDDIGFGDEVADTVTGFTGIVTAKALYATGCNQVLLSPPVKPDGTFVDGHWFDVERVTIKRRRKIDIAISPSGGPRGSDTAPMR